jgi:hypothetical protein
MNLSDQKILNKKSIDYDDIKQVGGGELPVFNSVYYYDPLGKLNIGGFILDKKNKLTFLKNQEYEDEDDSFDNIEVNEENIEVNEENIKDFFVTTFDFVYYKTAEYITNLHKLRNEYYKNNDLFKNVSFKIEFNKLKKDKIEEWYTSDYLEDFHRSKILKHIFHKNSSIYETIDYSKYYDYDITDNQIIFDKSNIIEINDLNKFSSDEQNWTELNQKLINELEKVFKNEVEKKGDLETFISNSKSNDKIYYKLNTGINFEKSDDYYNIYLIFNDTKDAIEQIKEIITEADEGIEKEGDEDVSLLGSQSPSPSQTTRTRSLTDEDDKTPSELILPSSTSAITTSKLTFTENSMEELLQQLQNGDLRNKIKIVKNDNTNYTYKIYDNDQYDNILKIAEEKSKKS